MTTLKEASYRHTLTAAFYDAKADYYLQTTSGVRWIKDHLPTFLVRLNLQGTMLDVGCAFGRAVDHLPTSLKYIGVDISSSMVANARRVHPGFDFRVGDICDLPTVVTEKCDAFLACMVLGHVDRDCISQAIGAIRAVMKPGAYGLITTFDHDEFGLVTYHENDEIPEGHALFAGGWSKTSLVPVLCSNGFEPVKFIADYSNGELLYTTVRAI